MSVSAFSMLKGIEIQIYMQRSLNLNLQSFHKVIKYTLMSDLSIIQKLCSKMIKLIAKLNLFILLFQMLDIAISEYHIVTDIVKWTKFKLYIELKISSNHT